LKHLKITSWLHLYQHTSVIIRTFLGRECAGWSLAWPDGQGDFPDAHFSPPP